MLATVLNVAKSKPASSKAVSSNIISVSPENIAGMARDGALDEIRRAYRQLVSRFHRNDGKAPATESGSKEGGATGDE